jgi:uncharacterized membrane protein YdjX (TVP38/TMEM64 family)
LLVVLAVPLVLGRLAPLRGGVLVVVELLQAGSVAGVAAYFAAHAVGSIATVPIWVFTGMAGYVYGPVRGVLLASPANLTALTAAFLLGRFVLSGAIGPRLAKSPRWTAVRGAVEADALRIGLLLRLSPIAPQNLMSYGFALTPMRFRTFVAVTWLGLLPTICFQVYVGSLIHDVADLVEGNRPPLGPWSWAATAAGIAVTVVAVVVVTRLGQRALARQGVGAP